MKSFFYCIPKSFFRKLKTGITVCIFIFILSASSINTTAQSFLHTEGQNLVNEQGERVFLKGVALGNWFLPEGYMWKFGESADRPRRIEKVVSDLAGEEYAKTFWNEFRKNYITEADIRRIAELGFNSVRPALNARLFLTEGDTAVWVDEGFELLDNLIQWCKKYKIYVIIDMHGAPGGQTGQNIDDSANDLPELFMDKKHRDRLIALWVKIAGKYKDEPIVAGYDLLNEPLPKRTGSVAKYGDLLEPLYMRITKAIREIDSKHMIILEGADWSNDWSIFSKPFDNNLVYQFHYYCWNRPDNLNSIQYFIEMRQKFNTPVWVGETGEKNAGIYFATTQYFEKNNFMWCFWPWKKLDASNNSYSVKKPGDWDSISAYTRNENPPSTELARKAYNELLENIKFENCTYHPEIVNAIFRRLPLKVEAENYGVDGYMKSFYVKDTTNLSTNYRNLEPVKIEIVPQKEQKWHSEQYIVLLESEWTNYTVTGTENRTYNVILKTRAVKETAKIEIEWGEHVQKISIRPGDWNEIRLNPVNCNTGINNFKIKVVKGIAEIDWLDFS